MIDLLDLDEALEGESDFVERNMARLERTSAPSVLDTQVGGSHYSRMAIQPVEFIVKNKIPYLESNVIKYVCRHEYKNGLEDINKAIQYLEMIKEFKYSKESV